MPIENITSVYYLAKTSNYTDINDTKLIIKALGQASPEKVVQLMQDHRFIQLENKDNQLTVKADAQIADFLASRNFSSVEIKHKSGKKEVIQSKVNIKTLTASESKELNKAVNTFLTSIAIARQEQVKEPESKGEEASKDVVTVRRPSSEKKPLRPSDYLKESALVSFKSRKENTDSLKVDKKRAEDRERVQEEKDDARKREIIKTENKKWDNKKSTL